MNYLALYLGILLFSFIFTSIAIVPWIDLLYKLQMTEAKKKIGDLKTKLLTPVGGGVLLISVVTFLFWIIYPVVSRFGVYIHTIFFVKDELHVIFLTFIIFGLIGLYDDLVKVFHIKWRNLHRYKNIILVASAVFIATLLFQNLGIGILNLPVIGVVNLGPVYIIFAALIILLFVKGFNTVDHMDGMSTGILVISLLSFWTISGSQLDTPISIFISLWIGSLVAFLYFNVFPARIWLGNCGSYSFGATLALIGLLLGKPITLLFIGMFYVVSAIFSFLKRNPLDYLLAKGWPEPKIVMRAWLFVIMSSIIGLSLAGL